MEIVIVMVLIIIIVITIGLLMRKRIYDKIDLYEEWKLDITNRKVAEELSKVKALNLEGETKEQFERWKNNWDDILTKDLAKVEELLLQAEQAADKYRFSQANAQFDEMENILVEDEKKIESILVELNDLLTIEASTREEAERLEPLVVASRKKLLQDRYKYAKAAKRLETTIEGLEEKFVSYHELNTEGNYESAATLLEEIDQTLTTVDKELEELPDVYKKCKTELPNKLDELYRGLQDMKKDGYRVEHLKLDKEINDYQARLIDMVIALETTEAEKIAPSTTEIEERITEMYDQLENEALAKNYVLSKLPNYEHALTQFEQIFTETQEEVERLQEAYYFEDEDLESYRSLEKHMTQLKEKLAEFTEKVEENSTAHSKLRKELEVAFEKLTEMDEEHEAFKERMTSLRKDELEAREQLQKMSDSIFKMNRKLKGSNLPGVPSHVWSLLDEATSKNDRVLAALENEPLDIMEIQNALRVATEAVEQANEHTNMMLDQAMLTENVIQYANRYRRTNPALAEQLKESEQLFRKAQYEEALETAARAIEAVEPGALKKIEKYQEKTVS